MESTAMPYNGYQGIFDCILAFLRFQTLLRHFCLECILNHTCGTGLFLEKLIKSMMMHIVVLGRTNENDHLQPVTKFHPNMTLRFRRVFWGNKNKIFRTAYITTRNSYKEDIISIGEGVPDAAYPAQFRNKAPIDVNFSILRHLDEVSSYYALIQCGCNQGRLRVEKSSVLVLRQNEHQGLIITPARWNKKKYGFEDPLWFWSLFGSQAPNPAIVNNLAVPMASICLACRSPKVVKEVQLPKTTWILTCELPKILAKSPVDALHAVNYFKFGGVPFRLGFALLYNTTSGSFSSLTYHGGHWFYYDDQNGIFKKAKADSVRYRDKFNLRVYFIRETESNPHECLVTAHKRYL
jgi:hypothetical protein